MTPAQTISITLLNSIFCPNRKLAPFLLSKGQKISFCAFFFEERYFYSTKKMNKDTAGFLGQLNFDFHKH